MTTTFRMRSQDQEGIGLRNDVTEIIVLPALGAKMISLRHLRSGREWMWAPADARLRSVPSGTPFAESSLVGADECIPTIEACRWRGRQLPDHGEVWSEPWELDAEALGQDEIVTHLRLPISPLWLERRISLSGGSVHLAYSLRNLSDEPYEYLWAFHPLIQIQTGDRLILPSECNKIRIDSALNCPLEDRGAEWSWPQPVQGIDLHRLDLGGLRRAVKFYAAPLSTGAAAIWNEYTGDTVAFKFDVEQLPIIGVWINRGGWNGYEHMAIEPATGAPDSLEAAVNHWKAFATILPNGSRQWAFQIEMGANQEPYTF